MKKYVAPRVKLLENEDIAEDTSYSKDSTPEYPGEGGAKSATFDDDDDTRSTHNPWD